MTEAQIIAASGMGVVLVFFVILGAAAWQGVAGLGEWARDSLAARRAARRAQRERVP